MDTAPPLVSVVIATYNHEEFIRQSIQSVLDQTYSNIQLIVIDDQSKDNSFEIIREMGDLHGFFYEKQENIGLAATLNKAIQQYCKGDYVAFLASDDYWKEDKIEKQINFFLNSDKKDNYRMCCSKAFEVDEKGTIKKERGRIKNLEELDFNNLIQHNCIVAASVIISTEVFKQAGYFEVAYKLEDWDFWLKVAEKYKVGYVDEALVYYRMHSNNTSNTAGVVNLIPDCFRVVETWKDKPIYKKAIERLTLVNIVKYNAAGQKKTAFKKWLAARKYFLRAEYWVVLLKLIVK